MEHPIQVVVRRTGLTADVIRAWERRYGAVSPQRSPTNRRLYSDEDIHRLRLLRQLTDGGRRISDVAGLSLAELEALADEDGSEQATSSIPRRRATTDDAEAVLQRCMRAVEELDVAGLERALAHGAADLGRAVMLDQVLAPLLTGIGERWQSGELRVGQEHMATAIVRTFLGAAREAQPANGNAPLIVISTPPGQFHELGAMMAGVVSALEGWSVLYLGPNMPTEELAGVVRMSGARAIGLSLNYPTDDPGIADSIRNLRRLIGEDMPIFVGGRGAGAYESALAATGALLLPDATSLRKELSRLRLP